MKQYVLKRVLMLIPTMLVITFISYMIMDLAPGDPALAWVDFENNRATPEMLAEIRVKLGWTLRGIFVTSSGSNRYSKETWGTPWLVNVLSNGKSLRGWA